MKPEVEAGRGSGDRGRSRRSGVGRGASEGGLDPERLLRRMFSAAVDAVRADACVPSALPEPAAGGRTVVVGAGKAAAAMARTVEREWRARGHPPPRGLVVTRYGHAVDCRRIEVVEAAHPVPDPAGREAAERILGLANDLGPEDLLLCLVSGGGSALLAAPARGVAFDDKQEINRALLASGANITEMNTVRKHLSRIKGGRLAAAGYPARCHAVLVSDVPGDDPATIASGPTVADPTTAADAREVMERYGVPLPASVEAWWAAPAAESPKPGDPRLARSTVEVAASAQQALEAAAEAARAAGYEAVILGDAIEGEAREAALVHAGVARQARRWGQPARPPCVLLSGGETTVTVRGGGRGGRNAEFLLALAAALDDLPGVFALAADTDGIDGTESNAGAVYRPGLVAKARALGLDPRAALDANDGYGFFAALGALVETGPTLTNVNDFRAIAIAAREP